MRWIFCILTLIGIATTAVASNCVVRQRAIVKEVAVVKEAIVVPVAVAVPLYSASYVPSAPVQSNDELINVIKQLEARLKAIEDKIGAAKPPTDPFNPKANVTASYPAVMKNKCAACHEAKVAQKSGGNFTLFNGDNIIQLNDKQKTKILTNCYTEKMPKIPNPHKIEKLTDVEVGEIVAYIEGVK